MVFLHGCDQTVLIEADQRQAVKAVLNALTYLNELEVHGERNCVLLVSAIKELKPLQTVQLPTPPQEAAHEPEHQP